MQVITRDITTIESGIIAHVCNDKGVMGAGVAKALYSKWPVVREEYMRHFRDRQYIEIPDSDFLGTVAFAFVKPDLYVANMVAQHGFGRDGRKYLDDQALEDCLEEVFNMQLMSGLDVYVPYNMGCGLAGGDWSEVSAMLERIFLEVTVCKMP
jgi:O-acetyl-ADP-ribose deacetylase (regulator of RNase III)